jgi:hypothetical protein
MGENGILKAANGIFTGELHAKNAIYGAVPEAKGGTLLKSISGYNTASLYLNAGWYYAELAGAGGGDGENYPGGAGGYLKQSFYIPYDNVYVRLMSGAAGGNAYKGDRNAYCGGGGGGGSVLDVPVMGVTFIANGGGGGGTPNLSVDGGGGGGYGGGGAGTRNGGATAPGGGGGGAPGGTLGRKGAGPSGGEGGGNGNGSGFGIYGGNGGEGGNDAAKGAGKAGGNNTNDAIGGGAAANATGWAKLYRL